MYKNILVPVVPDYEDGIRKSFSAARLLADDGAKFTVMHVMEEIPGYVRGQISDEKLAERCDETEKTLQKIASDLKGAGAVLVSGHAGRTIVRFAGENDIDCIVLSSHRPGIEKFFIGSVASRVVSNVGCSVHVIR